MGVSQWARPSIVHANDHRVSDGSEPQGNHHQQQQQQLNNSTSYDDDKLHDDKLHDDKLHDEGWRGGWGEEEGVEGGKEKAREEWSE